MVFEHRGTVGDSTRLVVQGRKTKLGHLYAKGDF